MNTDKPEYIIGECVQVAYLEGVRENMMNRNPMDDEGIYRCNLAIQAVADFDYLVNVSIKLM